MKKPLAALAIAALILVPLKAVAAVKAGDVCNKVGTTATANGKKYTCVKSGKKLVWDKGLTVAAPKPTAAPTLTATPSPSASSTPPQPIPPSPTASPTPTVKTFVPPTIPKSFQELEGNLSGIIYGAWLKAGDQIRNSPVNIKNIQVFSGPTTVPGNPDPLVPIKLASQLYSNFEPAKNVYVIEMANGDKDWAQKIFDQYADVVYGNVKTAVSEICDTSDCGHAQAHRTKSFDGILLIGKAPNYKGTGKSRPDVLTGMDYSHEYIHTIQTFNGKDRATYAPVWFKEGGATYASTAIAMSNSYSDYVTQRNIWLQDQYRDSATYTASWVENFINPYKSFPENADVFSHYSQYPRWYPYAIGCIVNEIFTVIKGPDAAMNIYKRLGQGQTFPGAFQAEFGISWSDAVPYISRAISAQLNQQIKS